MRRGSSIVLAVGFGVALIVALGARQERAEAIRARSLTIVNSAGADVLTLEADGEHRGGRMVLRDAGGRAALTVWVEADGVARLRPGAVADAPSIILSAAGLVAPDLQLGTVRQHIASVEQRVLDQERRVAGLESRTGTAPLRETRRTLQDLDDLVRDQQRSIEQHRTELADARRTIEDLAWRVRDLERRVRP
jgi:hypothetical protein